MRPYVWIALFGGLTTACLVALTAGDEVISFADVVGALIGADEVSPVHQFIVAELRLPRVMLGLLVGAALAVAGVATQALIRNPLAEPGLLGISSGAALAAMIVIVQAEQLPETLLPLFAFLGALGVSVAVYALAWRAGVSAFRLILMGIALGALAGACASFVSVFGPVAQTQRAMVWLAGSLNDSRWIKVVWVAGAGVPAAALLWVMKHELDLIAFGDTTARALGQRVTLVQSAVILAVACLAGSAVAAAGPIAFVGLVAPHIARRFVGIDHVRLIPAAAITGAVMVVLADLFARRAFAPGQLPVGLATALLGAPFFGYLLWKNRHG